MRSTFKVLFYVNGSKEKNGIVPIMGRVTINGSVAQFSCKQSIHKDLWDVKGNRAKGKSKESRDINLALDNIKAQIIKHYQRISDREAFVTAEMVRNAFQGIGTEYETLLRAFDKENEAFAKRVGKDRSLSTYQKYLTVRKYLAEFIKIHYKRTDIAMNELTEDFIRDYCLYLRNEVGLAQSSVWIYSIPLKHIVTTAHYNGKIARNPFAQYKVDPDHKERGFLTEDELQAFTTIELSNPDLELARDLFVFGCWTGISFIDIKNLTTENISILGGSPWIVSKRQKTGVPFQIKLMDIPMQIIKRYEPYRINTAHRWYPDFAHLLRLERFAKQIGLSAMEFAELIKGRIVNFTGRLFSSEHNRWFATNNTPLQILRDNDKRLTLTANRIPLNQWFSEQYDKLRQSIRQPIQPKRGRGMKT